MGGRYDLLAECAYLGRYRTEAAKRQLPSAGLEHSALLGWLRLGEPRPNQGGYSRFPDTQYVRHQYEESGWMAIQGTNKVPDLGPAKEHIKFALLARCDSVRRSLLTSARHGS